MGLIFMHNEDVVNICRALYDRLSVIKGYLILNNERKKVDYSIILLQELNEIESLLDLIVDHCRLLD